MDAVPHEPGIDGVLLVVQKEMPGIHVIPTLLLLALARRQELLIDPLNIVPMVSQRHGLATTFAFSAR